MDQSSIGERELTTFLSYADREQLLQSLDRLSDSAGGVTELLVRVGRWARELKPRFGFEHALIRNVTLLSNSLRDHQDEEDIANIASGAIRFVLGDGTLANCSTDDDVETAPERMVLSRAFVASYAVHESAMRLGRPATYNPPSISEDEQKRAESMFVELTTETDGCDDELIKEAGRTLDDLKNLAETGLLRRLANNAHFLIDTLTDPDQNADRKSCARGALRYLVKEDDVISDELGLIGYLDDHFIVQTAVDLINPRRDPLIELLDEVVAAWPFLNMLSIDDGSGNRPASEFAILNSALSCRRLRSTDALNTMLIAPETGPVAILVGFIATLGLAQDSGQREISEATFREGQKVLVDYSAVAEFAGFKTINDRRMFGLRQYYTDRRERNQTVRYWPFADLRRLIPADASRVVRGTVQHDLSRTDTPLPGLEYLFNTRTTADVHAIEKQIIVVMPTTLAAEFCKSVMLYGQSLREVVPVGQIMADDQSIDAWSSRFGAQDPILVFASDLDIARAYAEDNRDKVELVIVDATGRNMEKHASLKRLARFRVPYLLVASERVADEFELDEHSDLSIWEWLPNDLTALVWPESKPHDDSGSIARFEHQLKSTAMSRAKVESIEMPITAEIYAAFRRLKRLARQRGEEQLIELEELISLGFYATTHLLRCATPIGDGATLVNTVSEQLSKIDSISRQSKYLSADERTATTEFGIALKRFLSSLCDENPKAVAMHDLLGRHSEVTILCPDARLISDMENAYRERAAKIIIRPSDVEFLDGALILPGWFRQSRMASVLSPPIADPVLLLLYDIERQWYNGFVSKRREIRDHRREVSQRSTIFPMLGGWTTPDKRVVPAIDSGADPQEFEEVRGEVYDYYKRRIYEATKTASSEADVEARLVVFAGGSYGLFTDNYKLNVVTHLIESASNEDDENTRVRLLPAKEVRLGDAIVFRPRSRDLIREVADTILQSGIRDLSSLWREALLKYVQERNLSSTQLSEQLNLVGCKVGHQAVQNWLSDRDMIGPGQHRKHVPMIATLTRNRELTEQLDRVIDAISEVRSAHQQKAPRLIAKQVRESAVDVIRQEQADSTMVRLRDDLVLVRVAEIASERIPVSGASTNRLIEGDAWLE